MRLWYYDKELNKIAKFDGKGNFKVPYDLFKEKNFINPDTRAEKWQKARPIAPATTHPMRDLMGRVGRAWYFAVNQARDDQFDLIGVRDVPQFLKKGTDMFGWTEDELVVETMDITGCYPNMPQKGIITALQEAAQFQIAKGRQGIWVPHSKTKKCSWIEQQSRRKGTWLTWQVLLDVLEFSTHNAFIKWTDGSYRRQTDGIPMGSALSPGMAIGTCSWMERKWIAKNLGLAGKFIAARYMDDVLTISKKKEGQIVREIMADPGIYDPPLVLEGGEKGIFLETEFTVTPDNRIDFKLENANAQEQKVWRYHHYNSGQTYTIKRATMLATLQKVHRMASDDIQLRNSAMDKLNEFKKLGYPLGIRKYMCAIMARDTSNVSWRAVRNLQE